jgi:hypothetical protein
MFHIIRLSLHKKCEKIYINHHNGWAAGSYNPLYSANCSATIGL